MAAAAAAGTAPQQQFLTAEQFLRLTKPKSVKVTTNSPYVDGGRTTYRLPQAGLAHTIWLCIQASFVLTAAGGVASGTWAGWPLPAPFSMIQRLRFGSNNAFNMRDMNGWSLYKWIRNRTGIDPYPQVLAGNPQTHGFSVGNDRLLGRSMVNPIVPGANIGAATATYLANMAFPIPIGYNNAGEQGLLVLQQNSTFYDLVIDWGTMAIAAGTAGPVTNNLVTALTLTGGTMTLAPTILVTIGLDWFEPVAGIGKLISMFMSVSDMVVAPLVQGENIVRPPVNDYYTMLSLELVNNGTFIPPTNINPNNIIFQHSGNVQDYSDDFLVRLAKNLYLHEGLPPTDGEIVWDFGLRRGNLLRRDTLDAFDDMNITDLQLRFTNNTAIVGVSQATLLMESLRFIRQV
jgi:hypothetical protein